MHNTQSAHNESSQTLYTKHTKTNQTHPMTVVTNQSSEKRNVSTATVMQREKRKVSTATVMHREREEECEHSHCDAHRERRGM